MRFLDVVEELGLLSNTLVVFTADHGESLGEHHYYFEHGWYPYNATAWIPLVVYWPGVPEPGRRVTYPVSLVHLAATVVDLMGWEVPRPVPFHGRSLVPVLRGEQDRVDDYVLVEAGEGGLERDEFLRAIENGRWKLVHVPSERYQLGMQRMPYELYEVRSDPMETSNVVAEHPRLVELLRGLLEQRITEDGPLGSGPEQLPRYSQEEIESLRSLGYPTTVFGRFRWCLCFRWPRSRRRQSDTTSTTTFPPSPDGTPLERYPQTAADDPPHHVLERGRLAFLRDRVDVVGQVRHVELNRKTPVSLGPQVGSCVEVDRPMVWQVGERCWAIIVMLLTGCAAPVPRDRTDLETAPRMPIEHVRRQRVPLVERRWNDFTDAVLFRGEPTPIRDR